MTTERYIRIIAGSMIVLSLLLGASASPLFVSSNFLWLTAFVGANLLQFGFSNFCPMGLILRRLGVRDAAPCGR